MASTKDILESYKEGISKDMICRMLMMFNVIILEFSPLVYELMLH